MGAMTDRSTTARTSIEADAAEHAAHGLVMAYLLTQDWPSAEQAAAHAIVAGRRHRPTSADDGERLVVEALARRQVRSRWQWGAPGGGLHLQDAGSPPIAAVDDPGRLWSGLSQLTEYERTTVVLSGFAGLDPTEIAIVLGRSPADVARDLETAYAVVAQADASRPSADRDIAAELARFLAAHADLAPSTAGVRRRAVELDRRRRRARRLTTTVGTAAAIVVGGVGAAIVRTDDAPSASHQTRPSHSDLLIDSPETGIVPPGSVLPTIGPDLKLVGFQSVVVAVPAGWRQLSAPCDAITRNAVVFPSDESATLCREDDVPRGLSAVSFDFGREIDGEPGIEGEFGPLRTHGREFLVSRPMQRGGRFVAYASTPDLGFRMSVTTGSLRRLNRIIDSLQVLPAGYTTVPDCVGLPSGQVVALLHGQRLVPEQLFDHSALGLPLEVAQQSQSVGAVVPEQTRITLGMLPS
jgi:DNA-directed RNA polymerase specialized sigma24 family protein